MYSQQCAIRSGRLKAYTFRSIYVYAAVIERMHFGRHASYPIKIFMERRMFIYSYIIYFKLSLKYTV